MTLAGELNLDLVLHGLPLAMPVERELLASGFNMTLGSSSAILAHNMAKLGCAVGFAGLVGDDSMGRTAVEHLQRAGVDVGGVRVAEDGTATGVTVLLPHGGERHILTYPGTMADFTLADLSLGYLADSRHLHLSSLFLQSGLRPSVAELFRQMRAAGLTLSLDTNDDPEDNWDGVAELLPMVDVLLPNASEACRITGCDRLERAVDQLAEAAPLVVVKCGADGALLAQGSSRVRVPGVRVQPVDTIGAGDSFNAGFLSGYLRGHDPAECVRAGNACAALSTLRPGGVEAFSDDALRTSFLREHGPSFLQETVR